MTRSFGRLPYVLPALVFAALAIYLAYALRPGRDPTLVASALIDKPMPSFALPALRPNATGLASGDLAGKVGVLNFFASWCLPCRAEHPLLMRIAKEEGVPVYGIAYKDTPEAAGAWLDQLGDPFTRIGLDSNGRTGIDFGVYGVPETYVIDREGRIRFRQVGPLDIETLERALLPLIARLRQ